MKFRFIGDPNDKGSGPDIIELFGHSFTRTEGTDVPDDIAERLKRNSHFKEVLPVKPKGKARV